MHRPHGSFEDAQPLVNRNYDDVADRGDAALRDYTARFDGATLDDLAVSEAEFAAARAEADPAVRPALRHAIRNVRAFHQTHIQLDPRLEVEPGVIVWREWRPIERVGLYVPGGKAAYPSSVIMNVVPAQLAGCTEIVICTPPDRAGRVTPAILLAADLLGVHRVFKLGGAQAIAALALGTETVPQVYKLFGAGNRYVTAAKLVASNRGLAAIDLPAGPTEVLILADDTAPAAFVAADLIAQSEHADDSAPVLITTSPALAAAVRADIARQLDALPAQAQGAVRGSFAAYGLFGIAADMAEAIAFANAYAPEHLGIMTADPQATLARITNAGSVFLGPYSAQPAGDYAVGTNHVLPTGGYARTFGPLSVESFGRKLQIQQVDWEGLSALRETVGILATSERLLGHKAAIEARFGHQLSVISYQSVVDETGVDHAGLQEAESMGEEPSINPGDL
jgi:histidinol dehydrogenase